MASSRFKKTISVWVVVILLLVPALANLITQVQQPSPTPSPSPTVSPSPTPPPRTPSPTPLPGAQNFHQWGAVTVFNGLPSDSVRAISQTPDGVMWFGTDNGLARFDGRRVQKVSLGDADAGRVLTLKTSSAGELWIGTSSGAFVYADSRFQAVENTQGAGITAILCGTEDYLGTDNGMIFRVPSGALIAEKVLPEPLPGIDTDPLVITSLVETRGFVLAATLGRGVFSVRDGNVNVVHTPPTPGTINALATGGDGRNWLGTDAAKGVSGIYLATGGDRVERVPAPTAKVLTLEANDSGVWAGTERYGLFRIAGSKLSKSYTFANTSGGLRSDTIYTLFTDREGVLWIGTNRGASRFDQQGAFQQTVSDIPNSNFIRTLYPAPVQGELFYAGSNRGLFLQNADDKWIEVPGLRNKSVYAVTKRKAASLVVGTADGLYDIAGKKLLDGDVRSLAGFNGHNYAAVFGRGLFDITTDRPQLVYSDENITSISEWPDNLLIGTAGNGLFSFDGQKVKPELTPDILKSGTIWKISEHGNEEDVWIAGQHGVFQIKNGAAEQIIAVEDVRDIWMNKDDLWAATTTRGLIHAIRDPRFGWLTASIGFEQGLPSEKAFSIVPVEGGFLVGTNRGIVTYTPGDVAPKLIPVRVLSQRVHDLSEVKSNIDLEYPQNSLLVEVAGQSSRTFPEEFQYAFTLKNGNGETVDTRLSNDPQYAPTDLKPGDYTIEAIAFNRDLLASDPLTISFSIGKAPFPWTATALGVLLVLALVGLIWAVIEHRRMVVRNRELAAARLDLANEAERERRRIARDLHDQTLADLRNLMITSDKLVTDNSEFRNEIEAVSTEIRRICEDLSPSVLENVGLVAALEFLLDRTVEKREFRADDAVEDQIHFPLHVQLQIYRIAQEVLTNIKRHSDASMVEMDVEASKAGDFNLTIRDNGGAFQPNGSVGKGRGISNIRSRANLINGKVAWKESRRGGNVFSLKLGAGNG